MTAKPPLPTEAAFMRSVTDLATRRGWYWLHLATARYKDAWRTPFAGPLGKGWPDLVLFRAPRRLAWELKRDATKAEPKQLEVLMLLEECGFEVGVYRPTDWAEIEQVLK